MVKIMCLMKWVRYSMSQTKIKIDKNSYLLKSIKGTNRTFKLPKRFRDFLFRGESTAIMTLSPVQNIKEKRAYYFPTIYPLDLWCEIEAELLKLSSDTIGCIKLKKMCLGYSNQITISDNSEIKLPITLVDRFNLYQEMRAIYFENLKVIFVENEKKPDHMWDFSLI